MCNGKSPITIKTLHGRFEFNVQRFTDWTNPSQPNPTYFDYTDQFQDGYISDRLKEFSAYYSNRISYSEVAGLVERVTGDRQLSDQKIWEIVVDKALAISEDQQAEVEKQLVNAVPSTRKVEKKVAIYDSKSEEVLLFEDAIQVHGQKENRQHKQGLKQKPILEPTPEVKTSAIQTDIVIWQKRNDQFKYLTAPINHRGDEAMPLSIVLKSALMQEYRQDLPCLPIVVITDGAKSIRQDIAAVFGDPPVMILDWYHLGKKSRDMMSMIARNKEEKQQHLKFIFGHLWHGRIYTVLNYLKTEVSPKNEEKLWEFIGYLEKHKSEIIDYDRRKKAGKVIGSGIMEKGCDQVIGRRQKKKGMSWRAVGSRSLGILKVVELNNEWEKLWFPKDAANDSSNLRMASGS